MQKTVGNSLIEVLVALVIFSTGILSLINCALTSLKHTQHAYFASQRYTHNDRFLGEATSPRAKGVYTKYMTFAKGVKSTKHKIRA